MLGAITIFGEIFSYLIFGGYGSVTKSIGFNAHLRR
jgi:hypothetical protein